MAEEWTPEAIADNITRSVLRGVPEVCLAGCKHVCALRNDLTEAIREEHRGDGSPAVFSKLGAAASELSDFGNLTMNDPCAEPDPDGACTQGAVPRLI